MSVRDTQTRILDIAVCLFNRHGVGNISASQIAETCGISKGHLYYHYKNKEEIILAIVWKIVKEIEESWYRDDDDFSARHLADNFMRHMALNYKYRFFYRELPSLLRSSDLIKRRFTESRKRRIRAFDKFIELSAKAGVYHSIQNDQDLKDNVTATWVFADNWINYVEASGLKVDSEAIREGYRIMKVMLKPGLTEEAYLSLPDPEEIQVQFMNGS